ncbi:MAG: Glu/Leu/Phe/Val dehydrogenase [Kiritimatiellaeota bacterium]|nr:Glu/Leu/Phe/Val dehydrogenase [Kiritimatiellota bacterium]
MSGNNPLDVAWTQFEEAVAFLGLEAELAEFLRQPMREYIFTVPVRMDDGRTQIFQGYRIQHNDARGPCSGGFRWHRDESLQGGRVRAAWNTWRAALMDLPLGGASGGLISDSKKLSESEKERAVRGWMRAIALELDGHRDVVTPDLYTTPQIMAWMMDEFETLAGRAHPAGITGKPLVLGGTQGYSDALARGGVLAVREACQALSLDGAACAYAIQGFGQAGQHTALLHPEILGGGKLIAVSDSSGGVVSSAGLAPQALVDYKRRHGKVAGFPGATPIGNEDLLELNVDILYPAALEGVITSINAEQIRARIICELATGATTPEADTILSVRGVHVIPDFLASAGGSIVSYFEQAQGRGNYYWSRDEVNRRLDAKVSAAWQEVRGVVQSRNVPLRFAALLVAVARVAEAVRLRGWV